jgi:phospholipid/cholesterol/gamma-HCH transport system substrate-binding protein
MAKKISDVKIGIFIFLGILILVLGIFLVGDKDALFSSTFTIKAYFKDIQGLRSGATVRLSGIDVGSVESVEIMDDPSGRVEVVMSVLEDVRQFIRTDTKASIETEGLVGNKVVVLKIGSSSAEPVKNGGTVQAKEPLGFAQIIEETQGIMEYTKEMTKDLSEIIGRVNRGEGSIGKLLVDEELYKDATRLTKTADSSLKAITGEVNNLTVVFNKLSSGVDIVVNNINNVVEDVDSIVSGLQSGNGVLGALLVDGTSLDTTFKSAVRNIGQTMEDARLAASRLAENMEALKHNWLFKSYFEERGYWDKATYEDEIESKMNELNDKIKLLDDRIETLRRLEKVSNSSGNENK